MSKFEDLVLGLTQEAGLTLTGSVESPLDITIEDMVVTVSSEVHSGIESIVFSARLGDIDDDSELDIYRMLLEANVLWSGTAFGTLGVNSATRRVIFCYRCEAAALDGDSFVALLNAFVENAQNWRDLVAEQNALVGVAPPSFDEMQSAIRI